MKLKSKNQNNNLNIFKLAVGLFVLFAAFACLSDFAALFGLLKDDEEKAEETCKSPLVIV